MHWGQGQRQGLVRGDSSPVLRAEGLLHGGVQLLDQLRADEGAAQRHAVGERRLQVRLGGTGCPAWPPRRTRSPGSACRQVYRGHSKHIACALGMFRQAVVVLRAIRTRIKCCCSAMRCHASQIKLQVEHSLPARGEHVSSMLLTARAQGHNQK